MNKELAADTAAAVARRARYGRLPERVRLEDMTEEVQGAPGRGDASYDAEGSWKYYSCLALDLGL
ncbi:hypothetical protein ABZ614_05970 [Streptomyces sp. NPDC013178]|uniref:hypothetical protein n=1 Tax=unclassified Streptomyces TaxID=2593676 RepID=UPI0033D2D87F